jgi:uroporphyrinogen-III decarboxylase
MLSIALQYPETRLVANRQRLAEAERFQAVERVPVVLSITTRYVLAQRGIGFEEYYRDPRSHLYHQLMNYQWVLENVDDDHITSTQVTVQPDFQNTSAAHFGAGLQIRDDSPPWLESSLHSPDDVARLSVPAPDDHLGGLKLRWFREMTELAKEVQVTFNGQEVPVNVTLGGLQGPTPLAVGLVGEAYYWWLYEYPDVCHQLMQKVTQGFKSWETYRRQLLGIAPSSLGLGDDAGQLLSRPLFRKFDLPYLLQLYETFGGSRMIHMCGNCRHLLDILVDELRITNFNGFGFPLSPEDVAAKMSGKVVLVGNVNPMLIQDGSEAEIEQACFRCLNALAPAGGYILQDGNNITPQTDPRKLGLLKRSSERFGAPVSKEHETELCDK